jgi:uncharacterized protein YdaU (DUF1376 family)
MAFKPGHVPMAEFPGFTLWTDAYLGDTGHLTTLEHGAYLLLLITMWRAGGALPNDDRMLAKYARMTVGQWERIKPTLMLFFTVEGERLTQSRLTDELEFVRQKSKRQSENARSKSRKTLKPAPATAQPKRSHSPAPTPTPTLTTDVPTEHSAKTREPTVVDELSKVLDEAHVKAVIEHRKGFRGKFTPHAADLLAKKFARCPDPNAAADAMISNNWQGFEPEWLDRRQARGSPGRPLTGLAAINEDFRLELEADGYGNQGKEGRDLADDERLPFGAIEDHRRRD